MERRKDAGEAADGGFMDAESGFTGVCLTRTCTTYRDPASAAGPASKSALLSGGSIRAMLPTEA